MPETPKTETAPSELDTLRRANTELRAGHDELLKTLGALQVGLSTMLGDDACKTVEGILAAVDKVFGERNQLAARVEELEDIFAREIRPSNGRDNRCEAAGRHISGCGCTGTARAAF